MDVLIKTEMPDIKLFHSGKVRDVYDLDDKLLIVATDRLSAYDWILPDPIPNKSKILTRISLFWFDYSKDIIDNHLISANVDEYPQELHKYRDQLEGRSMLVKKAERVDIECIVRGYISGSFWKAYLKAKEAGTSTVLGFTFPDNMKESEKLPEPIFTPSTKADSGHDENISFEEMAASTDLELAVKLRSASKQLYTKASEYTAERGIILADTKFEFGFYDNKLILIDEVFTPDSSRFWPQDKYEAGRSQQSFDKQFVRDFLSTTDWDKNSPPPNLPEEIIKETAAKYQLAEKLLVGER